MGAAGGRRGRLLQGLQIAQRLLQGLDLPAVLGEVAGLQGRLRVVELLARLSDEVAGLLIERAARACPAGVGAAGVGVLPPDVLPGRKLWPKAAVSASARVGFIATTCWALP